MDPRYAGLPYVEALPLKHENGNFEVACNLLDPSVTPPSLVLDRVAEVAKKRFGVEVDDAYTIGMTVGQIRSRLLDGGPRREIDARRPRGTGGLC